MAWTQNGIDYICQQYGNTELCCINAGLSWYYTVGGENTHETGATAQVVSRLASGLVDSVTMTSPARGTTTQTQLNNANGSTVTLAMCQEIVDHSDPSDPENQWCYEEPPSCEEYTTQTECTTAGCYWYNGSCHTNPPTCSILDTQDECEAYNCYWYNNSCHSSVLCSEINNQIECETHGCFWYDGACHSKPEGQAFDYLPYVILGGGVIGIIIIMAAMKKRPHYTPR